MVSFSRRALAIALALSVALPARPVLVAMAGEPSASDKETARALLKDGDAKREKGDFKGAYESFKAAHAIMGVPTTGYLLGRAQADLGMLVEARDTLLAVTRMPPQPGENAAYATARTEAEKLADEIEPKIPSIRIVLTGVPEGASPSVTIDGRTIPPATIGVPRKHNPGTHAIVVTVGSVSKKDSVELKEGESRDITIDVTPTSSAEPPKPAEPEPPKPEEPPPPPRTGTSPLVWIGFGGAALFGVLGGVTGGLAFSKASAAKDGCDGNRCPPSTHDDIDSSKTFGTISTIAFGVAGVGLAVGVYGLFARPAAEEPKTAHAPVSVVVGVGSIGLVGRF